MPAVQSNTRELDRIVEFTKPLTDYLTTHSASEIGSHLIAYARKHPVRMAVTAASIGLAYYFKTRNNSKALIRH